MSRTSQVISLLDLVWESTNKGTGHSWERLNHAMRVALKLAIGAGFEFRAGDFKLVASHYRSGYWLGESMEWCYALAVAVGNKSAYVDYEAFKERPPFIADDVCLGDNAARGFNHLTGDRAKERLAVGFRFPWLGELADVTSFAADGQALIACTYHDRTNRAQAVKIKKRYTITREDIIGNRKDAKRRKDLGQRIVAMDKLDREAVLKKLGVTRQADFDALPVANIEKAIGKAVSGTDHHHVAGRMT